MEFFATVVVIAAFAAFITYKVTKRTKGGSGGGSIRDQQDTGNKIER